MSQPLSWSSFEKDKSIWFNVSGGWGRYPLPFHSKFLWGSMGAECNTPLLIWEWRTQDRDIVVQYNVSQVCAFLEARNGRLPEEGDFLWKWILAVAATLRYVTHVHIRVRIPRRVAQRYVCRRRSSGHNCSTVTSEDSSYNVWDSWSCYNISANNLGFIFKMPTRVRGHRHNWRWKWYLQR